MSQGVCPAFAGDPHDGGAHLAWLDGGMLRYARFDSSGKTIVQETVADGEDGSWSFGPALGLAQDGTVWLAYKRRVADWRYDGMVVGRTDSGWGAPILLFEDQQWGWAPTVAVDSIGTSVVFEQLDSDEDIWGTTRHWLVHGGQIVQHHSGALRTRADDRVSLVAGKQQAERHLFAGMFPWHADSSGMLAYSWSSDGVTWSQAVEVQSAACAGQEGWVGQPDAKLAPDGDIHLTYGCRVDQTVGGLPSVRHAVLRSHAVVSDQALTAPGELDPWHIGFGIGRVAVVDSGTVVVAYLTSDEGVLRVRSSDDDGASWSSFQEVANKGGDSEGRNTPALSSAGQNLFLAYSASGSLHVLKGKVTPPSSTDAGVDVMESDAPTADSDAAGLEASSPPDAAASDGGKTDAASDEKGGGTGSPDDASSCACSTTSSQAWGHGLLLLAGWAIGWRCRRSGSASRRASG